MNILDYLDTLNSCYTIEEMLAARREAFLGFCAVEKDQGGIDPSKDLRTKDGQESARLLFARTIEELGESFESTDRDHQLEELIDALNFALGITWLSPNATKLNEDLAKRCAQYFNFTEPFYGQNKRENWDTHARWLISQTVVEYGPFLAKLRNRSWQQSTQSPYWLGDTELLEASHGLIHNICRAFDTWQHFSGFFMAKHEVLQFRLRTKY